MKKVVDKSICVVSLMWILCYCGAMLFVWKYGEILLDSDLASEFVLADKLIKEGSIVSENWYYSTQLRIFDIQLFNMLGLLVSPNNWHVARTISQGLMLLCMSLTIVFCGRRICGKKLSILIAALMLCPFSFWNEFFVTMSGFYLPHIMLVLFGTGTFIELYVAEQNNNVKKCLIWCAIGTLQSIVCGLMGVRMGMNLYVPVFLAGITYITYNRNHWNKYVKYVGWCFFIYAGYMAGFLINVKVLANKFTYSHMENQNWDNLSITRLLECFSELLTDFGYPKDSFKNSDVKLFSLSGILGAAGLVTICIFIFSVWRVTRRFTKLSELQQIFLLITVFAVVVNEMSLGMLTYNGNGSYWLPIKPLLMLLIGLEIGTESWKEKYDKMLICGALSMCVFATSLSCAHQAIADPLRGEPSLKVVADWLSENGYEKGIAEFWKSNVITAWTNGEIEMWTVNSLNDMQIGKWLQSKEHDTLPSEDCFIIADANIEELCEKYNKKVVYAYDRYSVLA